MARMHDNSMNSRKNTTVNKALMEKVTKNAVYQHNEKKARRFEQYEKHFMHDQSVRKKEYL